MYVDDVPHEDDEKEAEEEEIDEKLEEELEEQAEEEEGKGVYLNPSQMVRRLDDQGSCQHETNSTPNQNILRRWTLGTSYLMLQKACSSFGRVITGCQS